MRQNCKACGHDKYEVMIGEDGHKLVKCVACGTPPNLSRVGYKKIKYNLTGSSRILNTEAMVDVRTDGEPRLLGYSYNGEWVRT